MSTLPFDIIALIIDTVEEKKDTNLLKKLALVSHCFHQICSKHLFATVELHDADSDSSLASSKKGFVKLLRSRPDIVNYISKHTYTMNIKYDNHPLSHLSLISHPPIQVTRMICSHPSFQISSEQFLVSNTSKSALHGWTGIN